MYVHSGRNIYILYIYKKFDTSQNLRGIKAQFLNNKLVANHKLKNKSMSNIQSYFNLSMENELKNIG